MVSQENYPEEKTEIIYGEDNIIKSTLEVLSECENQADTCTDSIGPSIFVILNHPVTMAFQELKDKRRRLRFIAEITKDNISYCKELMKVFELRHLDEVKGNFGLVDGKYYRASARGKEASPPPLLIASTLQPFVEQQQYFFNMLWKKAIPAKQRIKEIEEGLKREFIETIQDPAEIQNLVSKTITSAIEEIDIVFSTPNSFKIYEREGMIELVAKKVDEDVKIRILLSQDEDVRQSIGRLVKKHPQIVIRELDKSIKTKVTTILADRELSLAVELKDDTKKDSNEAMGLATYSNSESTVTSYVSIFETLWTSAKMQ